ncbi:hypothetical protein H0B56_12985 [Haloechinothrix sp. YIM 98757]|uniref:Uncharacterized protein n=1 Tax=Haloechinothrix aidingensis TaxID=2752311 RepID=A0A838AB70_9PSEU|nr:hypothetical protein [Haloechinothrix aidingensis]MBA0126458.1 hypothetical protein [Haloechinothrix aidingensis]
MTTDLEEVPRIVASYYLSGTDRNPGRYGGRSTSDPIPAPRRSHRCRHGPRAYR